MPSTLDLLASRAQARAMAHATVEKMKAETALPRLAVQSTTGGAMSGTQFWGGLARASGAKFPGGLSKNISNRIWLHWNTRQNARDIAEDSVHAYAMIHRDADTVVGPGLKLEPAPIADILGITPEAADEWSSTVSKRFLLWANSKAQHRSGQFTFDQIVHQVQATTIRDNDWFVRLYYSQSTQLINSLQFEIIDANQVRGDAVTSAILPIPNFADGIERDAAGHEKVYHIWTFPKDRAIGAWETADIPRIGEKSGRVMMIHGYQPEYSGQGRGYSQLGVSMQEWQELENYFLSEVKKAIAQSQFVAAVENTQQNPSNFLDQIGQTPAGPASVVLGAATVPQGVVITGNESESPVGVTQIEESGFDIPGSTMVFGMEKGDTLKYLANTAPNPQFEAFLNEYLSGLLAPYGMPLEWFKQHFDASYSAARGMLAAYWLVVGMKRKWLALNLLNIIYEMFLSCEIAAGKISCQGWNDPVMRAAWCACNWVGTPPIQIDPLKEATAEKEWLLMSATTGERVARNHNQSNFAANLVRNKKDFEDMPIPFWGQKITAAVQGPAQTEGKAGSEQNDGEPPKNGNGKKPGKKFTPIPAR